jgi:PAS domain S-box-containing protein
MDRRVKETTEMSDKHVRDNPNTDKAKRTRLRAQRARPTLGYLAAEATSTYNVIMLAGLVEATRERDANLITFLGGLLRFSPDDPFTHQRNALYDLVTTSNVDGLIINSTVGNYVTSQELGNFYDHYRPLPVVSIAEAIPGIASILVDNEGGMRDVMVHLIEKHGYRRIAFIRGPEDNDEAERRYHAYTQVLAEYGLPFNPDLVAPGTFLGSSGAAAIRLLMDERKQRPGKDFEVVAAAADAMAISALEALQERGIHVPDDVAVVGFDDIEEARSVTPPLTTVRQPLPEQGKQAAEKLLAQSRLIRPGEPALDQMILPTELIVRRSCGCSDPAVVQAEARAMTMGDSRSPLGESLEATLAARRQEILFEMTQTGSHDPALAEQLLDAFSAELKGESPGAFLSTLENSLRQVVKAGGSAVAWQGTLSVLRRHTLPHLDNREMLSRAENLWQQARVMIGEVAWQAQVQQGLQTERQTQMLQGIGQALISTTNMTELMNALTQELPRLGIPSCYLSLYENPRAPAEWARLMLAYDENGRVELEPDGQRFPSPQLVPEGMLSRDRPYSMVVEPLYLREDQIGLVLFEMGPRDGTVYEALRGQLSSALKGILLLQERQRGEEALARERNLLHAMIDNLPDYIYVKDNEGRFVLGNTAVIRQMGLASIDDLVGKSDFDFFPQELAESYYADEQKIIQSGEGLYEYEGPTLDAGEERWVSTSKVPLRDAQGKVYGFVGLGRDITVRKRAEESLARRALLLQTAAEVSRATSSILDVDELLPQVVELIRDRFNLYYAGLFLVDEAGEYAVLQAGTGEAGRKMLEAGHKLKVGGASMIGWCVVNTQARIALDVGKDAVRFGNPLLPQTRSEMALPLISRGRVIGAVTIQSAQPAAFTQEDITILQTMADQLANAVENARLFTERTRAEESLAREQYLMQALMDNVPDYIYFKDRESRFIRLSKALAQSFGLSDSAPAVGKTDFDFFTEEHARPAYEDEQTIIQTGQPLNKEEKETRPGRPDAWVSTTKMPLRDQDGHLVGTFGISRDISERKRVEEALARERNLLRSLIDNVPDYIYVKDTESRFITCNPSLARLMGVATPDEIVGKTDFDFYPPELAAKYCADEQTILQSGQPLLEHEEPVVDAAGNPGWVSTTKVPLRDAQGKVFGLVGMGRDITEHKQAEAERERLLAELERRALQLQTAAEVSRTSSSILNVDELLPQVVELIHDRFNLYYVGLFLVDETGQWAVLRAGTGEAGRKMLEAGHKLPVGGTSMLSSCIAQGKANVTLDVEKATRYENPYLPETRSEMALPLTSRGRAIGAMTIQSTQPAAFSQEDITTLQTMADQLANAIENAVLFDESKGARLLLDKRVRGLDCLNDIGRKLEEAVPIPDFLQWVTERIPPIMQYPDLCVVAIEYRGQVYGVPVALALPRQMVQGLRIGSELVGRLCIAYTEEHDFLDEESALLGDIARRVNGYLENQQLLSETQARARREQTLREITARVRSSTDPDAVMRALVRELGTVLGRPTFVRLGSAEELSEPKAPREQSPVTPSTRSSGDQPSTGG